MIAVIHQPYFLPWLGYFNKLVHADVFILLDNVYFRKNYFHNRTNIKNMHGEKAWLTLPVGSNYKSLPTDVNIVSSYDMSKFYKTVHHCYSNTKYFKKYWPTLEHAINEGYPNLFNINKKTISVIVELLGLPNLEIKLASQLYNSCDSTDRLIGLCQLTGATHLILGEGGSWEYHNLNKIRGADVSLTKQRFLRNHPIYPQIRGEFIPNLSVIDALFNVGTQRTLELLKQAWQPDNGFVKSS